MSIQHALLVIQQSSLALPAMELVLLIVLLSLSLVLRYNRCGMMIAYVFAYRWGWMVINTFPREAQVAYIFFGIFTGALAAAEMLSERNL